MSSEKRGQALLFKKSVFGCMYSERLFFKVVAVLDARSQFPNSVLADLYDQNTYSPKRTPPLIPLRISSIVKTALPDAAARVAVRAVWEEDGEGAKNKAERGNVEWV